MADPQTTSSDRSNAETDNFAVTPPHIGLPKGGGAIRGLGEKFGANPVTGTGSMTVPIATSPGRSGFGPQLSLSYDSGSGNGPFGFGWSLSLPSITRKTEKGLPQYRDAEESDVFILSGAEDLVPVLDGGGRRIVDVVSVPGYTIESYRPRIEGLFARIERWTRRNDGDVHWRSISKDNITTFYGKAIIRTAALPRSEIADPRIANPADATHIFSWLICESYDDKGNAIVYEYKAEDSDGIDLSSSANERNRAPSGRRANRYLKRIKYGNATPRTTNEDLIARTDWLFELVLDYGEHYTEDAQGQPTGVFLDDTHRSWDRRQDPFSIYRAGFEVRTYRLCRRALMFHHFATELGTPDCLVRTTEFQYQEAPVASFITAVTQGGFVRMPDSSYFKKSMPPVEFEYSQAEVSSEIRDIDPDSLENLPYGLDGSQYRWVDLDGEGVSGILTDQGDAWYYKPNLGGGRFGPVETVARRPSLAELRSGRQQLLDLAGDGQLDLVTLEAPTPGFFERTQDQDWNPFVPFRSLPNLAWSDPNLRFVDLTGDGHADVLVTEDDAFAWYASLAEDGFAPAETARQALDEEKGPRLVFADGTQSIYLADLSGDGLSDLVRIRNGEVCYWPNLGYCRFGAKVTMNNAPWFDNPDQFNQKRIHLADIDGSGNTDIIYLAHDCVRLYFNQSGNRWSDARKLEAFPQFDDLTAVAVCDLLGNGTACLVWSSSLPGDARRPMRYVDLMGGQKPHLLIQSVNNLGAETRVQYAASTRFYLEDKLNGKPWITRLPFPVHVVERVETYDYISRNRFVTTYKYHHGYFDGFEREFRGFAMVEQRDTEEFATLSASDNFPDSDNIDVASHVPPLLKKTWFHTGFYLDPDGISNFFAGAWNANDAGEYYREPGLTDAQAAQLLLDDTVLPAGLTIDEEREACRALKGSMLRQEVYALDGSDKEKHPYTVTEQNFTIQRLQPQSKNRHGVFFTHAREAINFHYERNPADPRVQHTLTLEVDSFGNVLKSAALGYGRRMDAPDAALLPQDREKQRLMLITCTENDFTNAIVNEADTYRTPLPAQSSTYELRKAQQEKSGDGLTVRYRFEDILGHINQAGDGAHDINYEDIEFAQAIQAVVKDPSEGDKYFRRLIEQVRTLYRPNDLGAAQNDPLRFLPLKTVESMALPGESYKLSFTPGLLALVYARPHAGQPVENLLPDPTVVLPGQGGDRGGYLQSQALKANGLFPYTDPDDHWWIPSGRSFFSANPTDNAVAELTIAQQHFFLPRRYRDPFGQNATVNFDAHDLLMIETSDALGNRVTVDRNDYRVLHPRLVSDPNRNQTEVAFDVLGLVAGTAVMGKPSPAPVEGDSLAGFVTDPTQAQIDGFNNAADPHTVAPTLLQNATTRIVYDLDSFRRTQTANPADATKWLPAYAATLVRETHASDPLPPQGLKIQISFSYSDGFSRKIQKKIQAELEKVGGVIGPPRWVGSGWTIFNNKGKPVRQYEPFFSATHGFEFGVQVGVSPILFYDPVERVVATLHPNYTYEKVVFDPWRQVTWDVNDTVLGDPRTDTDIQGYTAGYFAGQPASPPAPTWQSWYAQRQGGALGAQEQAAAAKAAAHADTPTTAHFDTLGRPFLTLADNGPDPGQIGQHLLFGTRVELDIEGNQREVRDAIEQNGDQQGRIVMRYAYDILKNRIHQLSMEAGARWMLNDVMGKPLRVWDSRGHNFATAYDVLRRPIQQTVQGTTTDSDPRTLQAAPLQVDNMEYGEGQASPENLNLRTRVYQHSDSAGVATNAALNPITNQTEAYDFKGNLLRSSRQLVSDYNAIPDWLQNPQLNAETFTSSTRYDALNRLVQSIAPHSSLARAKCNIIQPVYNEASLLERVDVWLGRVAEPAGPLDPTVDAPSPVGLSNIDYDAKGQRQRIDYKNGASTFFEYDPLTFRLVHLLTRRGATAFPDDCAQPPPAGWPGCQVQNLSYTYDPVGNMTYIQDGAQQTVYFKNQRVAPSNDYTYDALYRLTEATGREHLGQGGAPIPNSYNDAGRVSVLSGDATGRFSPNDGNAMGTYIESYVYDAVGNVLEMQHRGGNPVQGWSRAYTYAETSLIEDGSGGAPRKISNRLSQTRLNPNSDNPVVEPYSHDVLGNMVRMPHLGDGRPGANMHWDYKNQLRQTDLGGGGTTYYVYDASGQRVRKVWEKSANLIEERIYLGGFEIFRRHAGAIGADTATLERETLHVMDDKQRIALVETRTLDKAGTDPAPAQLIRYQFGNHLGSAILELDDQAQIISYEEYTPYGSTSYQAVRSQTETAKRYRYTGKERDEESGFDYFGARYCAAWLGRWTSGDPSGLTDTTNLYLYVANNPITHKERDGRDWGDFAEGFAPAFAKSLAIGLMVGAMIATAPVSIPTGLTIAIIGVTVASTAASYVGIETQRAGGVITARQADTEKGALFGALFGAILSGGVKGPPRMYPGGGAVGLANPLVSTMASEGLSVLVAQAVQQKPGGSSKTDQPDSNGSSSGDGQRSGKATGTPEANDTSVGGKSAAPEPNAEQGTTPPSWPKVPPGAPKPQVADLLAAKPALRSLVRLIEDDPQIHHVASDKDPIYTPKFAKLFEGAGMTLQDDLNKVSVEGHSGPHGPKYNQPVLDRLSAAVAGLKAGSIEYANAFRTALGGLRKEVSKPGTDMNDLVTKPH